MNKEDLLEFQQMYQTLSPLERDVLAFFTIAFQSLTKKELLFCLQRLGARDHCGKRFSNSSSLNVVLNELKEKGFLVADPQYRCVGKHSEMLMRFSLERENSQQLIAVIREIVPMDSPYHWRPEMPASYIACLREIRIGIYTNDLTLIQRYEMLGEEFFSQQLASIAIYSRIYMNLLDIQWFRSRLPKIQICILKEVVLERLYYLENIDEFTETLDEFCLQEGKTQDRLREVYVTALILRGNLRKARQVLEKLPLGSSKLTRQGSIAFLLGENSEAIGHYQQALKALRKETGKRNVCFNDTCSVFYALALIKSGDITHYQDLEKYLNGVEKLHGFLSTRYECVKAILFARRNRLKESERINKKINGDNLLDDDLASLLASLYIYWYFPEVFTASSERYPAELFARSFDNGYKFYAQEAAGLLAKKGVKSAEESYEVLSSETGMPGLQNIVVKEDEWLVALKNLANTKFISQQKGKKGAVETECRLIWILRIEEEDIEIYPKEQKITAKGTWTKGRAVALKRLKTGELPYMTSTDRKIASTIQEFHNSSYYYYSETTLGFDRDKALVAMVGHPFLFLEESPDIPVEFIQSEPELVVSETKKGFELTFNLDVTTEGTRFIKETPTRYRIIPVTKSHCLIAETIGKEKLAVPKTGKKLLLDAVKNVSSLITVHSTLEGIASEVPLVKTDSRVRVFLLPLGQGFKAEIFVKPFGDDGPYYKPGTGGENVFAEINGERAQSKRDLVLEKKNVRILTDDCPLLMPLEKAESLVLDEPEQCLELILELQKAKEKVIVEWPKGGKLHVAGEASYDQLKVKIKRENDWFGLTGKLKINESLVLTMQELIELTKKNDTRFVRLDDGQFLALTEEFRKRLSEVSAYSETKGNGLIFHPLATLAVQDFTADVKELKGDLHWKKQVERVEEAYDIKPVLPSTFQAELRDYQAEGYSWLTRLAAWGVGACLADDMGLGKTIQGLAILLERAKNGPSLVVAPASVCMNWIQETTRFAPTLNIVFLGNKGRKDIIKKLEAFDLLVCSYGILQSEEKVLAEVKWSTVVLDEAQFIKNTNTKRSKAAMKLKGDFKLITTGTPVENHLGELWNLFNFINPGLLGSAKNFRERFAVPIEENRDLEVKLHLKKLIQPFILRRLKSDVLNELPPKTEILLSVEMSEEEMAFYEALRRKAEKALQETESTAGKKHIKILAEMMKLRRACCHSRLIAPESSLKSTKQEIFWEVVDELRANNHKVLVFSQFVDHLSIIRNEAEKREISYQYLDGSTQIKDRVKRVKAFQEGEGEMFLISLKAGGVGLNLTAANYVIHMDPWWNPAVEDQASDRSHRIGQKNPVTIYRLVTKGTIEEKIVQLHLNKRDLASSLLEGTEASGKMSFDDLLHLITDK